MNVDQLLKKREAEYGTAWITAGVWLNSKAVRDSNLFQESIFIHNFVLILSKLARALHSPYNVDHWQDIAGYATLVANWLTENLPEEDGTQKPF
jgi:hypothetical protein